MFHAQFRGEVKVCGNGGHIRASKRYLGKKALVFIADHDDELQAFEPHSQEASYDSKTGRLKLGKKRTLQGV
jgi:hypothetical protein